MECCLFVYGTLKRRQKNHSHLSGAEFISEGTLTGPFRMYEEPFGNYPIVVSSGSGRQKIFGEVYRITNRSLLRSLDDFEDVPLLYRRVIVLIRLRCQSAFPCYLRCFMYLSDLVQSFPEHGPFIESGCCSE